MLMYKLPDTQQHILITCAPLTLVCTSQVPTNNRFNLIINKNAWAWWVIQYAVVNNGQQNE